MGFYYGPSSPPPDEKQGTLREALAITWMIFKALALPLGIIIGGVALLVLLFFLFTWNGWAALALLIVIGAAFGARAIWERRHPPTLSE
jgi:hypothetical protein